MTDAIIVAAIIAVAAGYLVRRFIKKGASGGCGCGSDCGGCSSAGGKSSQDVKSGCSCSSHKE
ncbi:FeoB-associated Cys-rich membrane protein [Halodesulfovibrio aestuarii]|uniref:FeoB-associated Cys-rich membrane protein n=1 Tax=Halodesulfovibrio aestuarii TaxID=126333 RepID=A0A8G2FBU0_9BACT|nr:FeoB-associated Cys-rich membrane protein [Halodesulfovibrio aestuarii]SHJ44573.1 Virus attachment protein p12 family protein [Halodesulfovibrio aestuarii]